MSEWSGGYISIEEIGRHTHIDRRALVRSLQSAIVHILYSEPAMALDQFRRLQTQGIGQGTYLALIPSPHSKLSTIAM